MFATEQGPVQGHGGIEARKSCSFLGTRKVLPDQPLPSSLSQMILVRQHGTYIGTKKGVGNGKTTCNAQDRTDGAMGRNATEAGRCQESTLSRTSPGH